MQHQLTDALTRISDLEEEVRVLRLALDVTGSIDQHTGLGNRNALMDAIEDRRQWSERNDDPFGVLIVELPAETDGPHAGALVRSALRGVDRVSSWGTWVIGAALPGLTPDHVDAVGDRIRRSLELAEIPPDRIVFGFSDRYPPDLLLRGMESGADIAPGALIIDR